MSKLIHAFVTAGAIALTSVAAVSAAPAKPAVAQKQSPTEIRRILREDIIGDNVVYKLIKGAFPTEYQAFEDQMVAYMLSDGFTPQGMQDRINRFETGIRETVGPYRKLAPDDRLLGLARMQLDTILVLQRGHRRACHEMAESGFLSPQSINEIGDDAVPKMLAFSQAGFETAIAGRATPVKRAGPSVADDQAIIDEYIKRGGDPMWLQAINSGQGETMTAKARCTNGALWWQSIMAQPNDRIVRVMTR
ncbi:hypothetical protein GVN21_18350 [Caulobacter sp. SLTY]|uniref:hypothetical protein n=1 Tax=Caulobacter sp. SLTY TaxID=2683262 RepID=UPI00141294AE|nr:hypothetical protein [Caulobacter sp. SLTY]NBB17329.1 hypothetical protein [Caulobacter sp. SLTY]